MPVSSLSASIALPFFSSEVPENEPVLDLLFLLKNSRVRLPRLAPTLGGAEPPSDLTAVLAALLEALLRRARLATR